jgi:hypothetical protein
MILGIFSNPIEHAFLGVVFKCGMLSALFRNCVTLCQNMANIFGLNFQRSGNSFDGQFLSKCIQRKGMQVEDLVGATVCIDKIFVES